MARHVHLLGEGGRSACCGKTLATLGFGAIMTPTSDYVTCEAYQHPAELMQEELELVEQLKQRPEDQPLPIKREGVPDVQTAVIADIVERRELGIKRYGTPLQTNNGRDALLDLYQELLDGACYAKQLLLERTTLLNRIAELEAELAMMRRES